MNTNSLTAAAAIPATVFRVARRLFRRAAKPARLYWLKVKEQRAEDHISDLQSMHESIPKNIVRMHRLTVRLAAKRQVIERGVA